MYIADLSGFKRTLVVLSVEKVLSGMLAGLIPNSGILLPCWEVLELASIPIYRLLGHCIGIREL